MQNRFIQELKQQIQSDWQNILEFFKVFLKNPLLAIRKAPPWHWQSVLVLMLALSSISGTLYGLVEQSFVQTLTGALLLPISSVLLTTLATGFFYYSFLFFYKKEIPFLTAFTLVFLSALPSLAVHPVSGLVPALNLIGTAFSAILLIVGFVENFQVPKKSFTRFVAILYIVYLATWIFSSLKWEEQKRRIEFESAPESIEILEKEFK